MTAISFFQRLLTYKITQRFEFFLAVYWLSIQLTLFAHSGMKFSHDSTRFIDYSYLIMQGNISVDFNFWYISYSLLIAAVNFIGLDLTFIIIIQVIVSGLATLVLFLTTKSISGKQAAFIITFLYTSWLYLQMWNFYIAPESIFISCVVFIIFLLQKDKRRVDIMILLAILVFTTFLRPNGFCLLIASLSYFAYEFYRVMPR